CPGIQHTLFIPMNEIVLRGYPEEKGNVFIDFNFTNGLFVTIGGTEIHDPYDDELTAIITELYRDIVFLILGKDTKYGAPVLLERKNLKERTPFVFRAIPLYFPPKKAS